MSVDLAWKYGGILGFFLLYCNRTQKSRYLSEVTFKKTDKHQQRQAFEAHFKMLCLEMNNVLKYVNCSVQLKGNLGESQACNASPESPDGDSTVCINFLFQP